MASAAKINDIRQPAFEPQSARVTVLMTPDKKAQIEADAARLGISSGQYIRLAVDNFIDPEEEEQLKLIAEQLNASVPRMIAKLDHSIATLEAAHVHVDGVLRKLGIRS
ncbi:MAG: hypothetical protein M3N06_06035 [Pseudomonadota bacterium]|nr:hypothetical protein [Pseudomonadota bacterium]